MQHVFTSQSALAARPLTSSENPYNVLDTVRTLRSELALTPNDLVTLQALISFLPRGASSEEALLTVFPSNLALATRTNGLDERTIRRSIRRLIEAGLIARRDSATRKRFPLRYGGVIRDAFGFDLRPLFVRKAELASRAAAVREDQERLRSLRATALALRIEAIRKPHDDATASFLGELRNILRRATLRTKDVVAIIHKLASILGREEQEFPAGNQIASSSVPDELTGTDGRNVRLVETQTLKKKDDQSENVASTTSTTIKLPNPKSLAWHDLKAVSAFFPSEPKNTHAVTQVVMEIGAMLRIQAETIMHHFRTAGPGRLLVALDFLIAQMEKGQVHNPKAYLAQMIGQGAACRTRFQQRN